MNQETYPERNLHTYLYLIYDKRDKNIQWRKDSFFYEWCWENWTVSCKKIKSEQSLTPHININSKWIKDLNVRLSIIKTLEKNIGRTLSHINHRKIFSKPLLRVMKIKTNMKNAKFSNFKTDSWETVFSTMKRAHRKEENICKWSDQQGINLQNMQQLMQLNIKKEKKLVSPIKNRWKI